MVNFSNFCHEPRAGRLPWGPSGNEGNCTIYVLERQEETFDIHTILDIGLQCCLVGQSTAQMITQDDSDSRLRCTIYGSELTPIWGTKQGSMIKLCPVWKNLKEVLVTLVTLWSGEEHWTKFYKWSLHWLAQNRPQEYECAILDMQKWYGYGIRVSRTGYSQRIMAEINCLLSVIHLFPVSDNYLVWLLVSTLDAI